MRPTVVENAVRALEILKNATAEGRTFPLILVDAMMPEMDGFELSAEITARQELAGATILMLSSAGPGGNVERCREVGVSAYLHKPIKSSELLDAIVAALAVKAVPAAPPPADADAPLRSPRPRRILLAEDNAINQDLAVALLEMWGHTVVVVDDGRQAVEATARETFDLVLMDVQMPTMSGIEATAAIRERERATGGHVPIVAMTARAMKGDHDECLAAGMDGYVGKPFDRRQLFDVIEATAGTAAADDAVSAVA
jgi:CheY-like chemotaxis protein